MSNDIRICVCSAESFNDRDTFERYISRVSKYRREKIEKYRFMKDKALSLAAGLMLSYALESEGISEMNQEYIVGEHGRPELKAYPDISFNISHSGNMAALVFSTKHRVAIDIEQIRQYPDKVAEKYFSPHEKDMLYRKSEGHSREEYFYACWTRKEAYGKLAGSGLDFSDIMINNTFDNDFLNRNGIYMKTLSPVPGYIVSAASNDREILGSDFLVRSLITNKEENI